MQSLILFGLPFVIIGIYWRIQVRNTHRSRAQLAAATQAGLLEPPSLHPLIDSGLCIGCGSCVQACPEGNVIGLVKRKAMLINPSHCIGHGACAGACPMDAISLVFGTATRGIDIPLVQPNFETNIPGIFIAGELGGMGLIRNAIEQGRQALEGIAKRIRSSAQHDCDVLIVGAGPAGIAASLAAMEKKLRYITIEQDSLGGTVSHYPRGKVVMTAPVKLPLMGKMHFKETTKENLLAFWQQVEQKSGVQIRYHERMEQLLVHRHGFTVQTNRGEYQTGAVLLAIGRRGTPRKLGVAGEELSKVVYRLIDPEQYQDQHVLVVGGGDSALEAAISIAEQPGTQVTLSYRSGSFSRAKVKNRERVEQAQQSHGLQVLLNSNVKRITGNDVEIDCSGELRRIPNQAVIICAGGILPTPLLKEIGITVETKFGTQ